MPKNNRMEIIDFLKREGPILPAQLSKELNTNLLFASAILSELASKKEVLISNVKRGGSPFYYVKGQEHKLEKLSEFLSGKPKEAFNLLKERKVIRDKTAEPAIRVALREIKDYAIGLNVGISGEYEIFWKYYLTGNEETKKLIKEELGVSEKSEEEEKTENPIGEKENEKEEIEEKPIEEKKVLEKTFDSVDQYFVENDIYIISQDVIRKNKEINYIVDVPTNIGKLRYLVKFKDKKSITDKDLKISWEEGNEKKLPILFITNGELTKKAQKFLNDNVSGQFIFKKF